MSIFLVRHGQTAFNRDGKGLGHADLELTLEGAAQARALGARFAMCGVRRVLSSPLRRAADVARAIAEPHGLRVEEMGSLVELNVGETEGLEFAEIRRRFPEFLATWGGADGWKTRLPGGESIADIAVRLEPLVATLMTESEGDTVVVSHNFVLRTLLCSLLGLEIGAWRSFQVDLASVTCLTLRNGRIGVAYMNDRCHLGNLNLA